MEAGKIQGIMKRLNGLSYQKVLFNGPWGIGKTKHILDSIEGDENIVYVSLFGKNNTKTFYEELYYQLVSSSKAKRQKVLTHMDKIDFSKFGFSVSVPLMADILTSIQKELSEKQDITIIIDDLERRSEGLNIKEIFGFMDSITRNEKIKVVLVASTKNLIEDEKKVFDDYAEKSIDRIYEITSYSKDAPLNIMGNQIWNSIESLYTAQKITNLRSLKKTKYFIEEVIEQVPEDIFNEKISKEDIYKICAAVTIFVVDHNKETILIPDFEKDDHIKNAMYNIYKTEEKYPDYIWHYILQNNLENSMMQSFIPIILKWFETGDFYKDQFDNLLKQVESYKKSTIPLFMSDSQLEKEITDLSSFINNLDKNISLKGFMQRLDELASIAEKTNLKFTYSVEEVVGWILEDSNFDNSIHNAYFDLLTRQESDFINKVIEDLKVRSVSNYSEQIISKMIMNVNERKFKEDDSQLVRDFKQLYDTLKYQKSEKEKRILISKMIDNKWLLPLPSSEITDEHWSYCHNIFQCIAHIDNGEDENIKENASKYFNEKIRKSSDEIFKYRMRSLIEQYLK